jgi:hypothetical protein
MRLNVRIAGALVGASLLATACGGGGSSTKSVVQPPISSPSVASVMPTPPPNAGDDGLRDAVTLLRQPDSIPLTVAEKIKVENWLWDSYSPGEQKDFCERAKTPGFEATAQSWADGDKRPGGLYEDTDVKWIVSWLKDHC